MLSPHLENFEVHHGCVFELTRPWNGQFIDPRGFDLRPGDRILFNEGSYRREFTIGREGRLGSGNLCLILDLGMDRALRLNIHRDALTNFMASQRILVREGVPTVRIHEYFTSAAKTHFVVVDKMRILGTLVDVAQAFSDDLTESPRNPIAAQRIRSLRAEKICSLLVEFARTTAVFSMIDDLNAINLALCQQKNGLPHFCVIDTGRVETLDTFIVSANDTRGHSTILNNPTFQRYLSGPLDSWRQACHAAIVEERKAPAFARRIEAANAAYIEVAQAA